MASAVPEYCPYCGEPVTTVDPGSTYRCEACESSVYTNPAPNARVAVVDDRRILLHEIPAAEEGHRWTTPGGHVELEEHPHEAAARELAEETGLSAEPESLVLFDARTFEKFDGSYKVWLLYAVRREATTGRIRPGPEASAVRFWTPRELADAGHTFTPRQPREYRELDAWIEGATAAIEA